MNSAKNIFVVLFCLTLLAGCGSDVKTVAQLKDTNMRKIHALYKHYMDTHGMQGPASKEALMEFVDSAEGKFALKRMEMDPNKIDDYFKSERDGQEFVIRYGLGGVVDHAIVFEAVGGEDGTRLVALTKPTECDDEEYDGYLSGKVEGESGEEARSGFDETIEE